MRTDIVVVTFCFADRQTNFINAWFLNILK
jgi:hypothetical protein